MEPIDDFDNKIRALVESMSDSAFWNDILERYPPKKPAYTSLTKSEKFWIKVARKLLKLIERICPELLWAIEREYDYEVCDDYQLKIDFEDIEENPHKKGGDTDETMGD